MTIVPFRATFTQYLIEQRRSHPDATGEFNELLLAIAQACKTVSRAAARGALFRAGGEQPSVANADEGRLESLANEAFIRTTEWPGVLSGMASEDMRGPLPIPGQYPRGKYLLVFDPLDGSGNVALDMAVGSVFSVLRAPVPGADPTEADFLQAGARQVAAGYALYGPSTMLVLTVGSGVVGFTLDRELGDFVLTHPDIRVPESTCEVAINTSNSRFWEAPVKRYIEEALAGETGPRGRDFDMRWTASLVAEAHRVLMRGGVVLYPRDARDPGEPGRLRLLYECDPIGLLVEQAGGRASTGDGPVLAVEPTALHERVGFVFGSRDEVERVERYHAEVPATEAETPLFNQRGLFRQPG